MNEGTKITRRRYSAELKQLILAECAQPGVSVASVALSHGINANIVHKWRRAPTAGRQAQGKPSFVPMALPCAVSAPTPDIRIDLRRGATSMSLTWPLAAAEHCAVWMRELLK